MELPPSGWYPDPYGVPGLLRWWDGSTWTQHTHQAGGTDAAQNAAAAGTVKPSVKPGAQATTVQPAVQPSVQPGPRPTTVQPAVQPGPPPTTVQPDAVQPTVYQPAVTSVQPTTVHPAVTSVQPTAVQPAYMPRARGAGAERAGRQRHSGALPRR